MFTLSTFQDFSRLLFPFLPLPGQVKNIVKGHPTGGNLPQGHDNLLIFSFHQKGLTLTMLFDPFHGQVDQGEPIYITYGGQAIFYGNTGYMLHSSSMAASNALSPGHMEIERFAGMTTNYLSSSSIAICFQGI